jgi:hypothetical protein
VADKTGTKTSLSFYPNSKKILKENSSIPEKNCSVGNLAKKIDSGDSIKSLRIVSPRIFQADVN